MNGSECERQCVRARVCMLYLYNTRSVCITKQIVLVKLHAVYFHLPSRFSVDFDTIGFLLLCFCFVFATTSHSVAIHFRIFLISVHFSLNSHIVFRESLEINVEHSTHATPKCITIYPKIAIHSLTHKLSHNLELHRVQCNQCVYMGVCRCCCCCCFSIIFSFFAAKTTFFHHSARWEHKL